MRYILWSGGWDSTYLLCKMARESEEAIQPIYIVFPERSNTENERSARRTMLPLIRSKADIKAEIREPLELQKEGLPYYAELDKAYAKYEGKIISGFSTYGKAALLFPGLAVATEAPSPASGREMSRTKQYIVEGGLTFNEDGSLSHGETYNADAWTIFGGLRFPIININKAGEMEEVKAWGYFDDIFVHTWGCYKPGTHQCGVCGVCDLELSYGDLFRWRYTEHALLEHDIMTWLRENKGETYADAFRQYAQNDHHISGMFGEVQSEQLANYFGWLEKHWPDVEDINAPAL